MAKTRKGKLPKRIGGVKLPKEVRKTGGRIAKVVNSPAGRELIAAGLTIAAAAVTAAVEKERVKRRIEAGPKADGVGAGKAASASAAPLPAASNDPHEFGAALGKMAEAALAGLFKPRR
jgi:hypothetical protein